MSEIAFDKERHFAAVKYSFWCGSLCGHGRTLVLEKVNGKWQIETETAEIGFPDLAVDKTLYHSLTYKNANERRTLAITPVNKSVLSCGQLGGFKVPLLSIPCTRYLITDVIGIGLY